MESTIGAMRHTIYHYNHGRFTIYQLPALRDNYIYLIANATSGETIVVDPADTATVAIACSALGLTPVAILNTHHHWDHTDGNAGLVERYRLEVIAPNARIAGRTRAPEATMELIGLTVQTIPVPGHTLDHVAYRIDDALLCGDTLFGAGCGRIFEGSAAQMWRSLQTLAQLPAATALYCAHEYTLANLRFARQVDGANPLLETRTARDKAARKQGHPTIPSTIGEELATNPFLRPLNGDFCRQYARDQSVNDDPLTVFTHLRHRKDNAG